MKLTAWVDQIETPAGIGVDIVEIAQMEAINLRTKGAFVRRTFTAGEQAEADVSPDRWSYLAGRFAVKEAVFKALARLTPEKNFDFRVVETLRQSDGSPAITCDGPLMEILRAANVDNLLVSISNESGFSMAFVAAVFVN